MRIGRGCEPCRRRHIRCSTDTRASICDPCARANRPCRLGPPFRFQSVRHVYQKSNRAASNLHLDWGPDQVWVKTPHRVTFVQDSSPWSHGDPGLESQGVAHPSVASLGSRVDVRRVDTPPVEITDAPTTPSMTGEQRTQTTTAISPTTGNVPSPLPPPAPALTTREAFLLRAYTQKIAPWADICDLRSHFTTEVPRRALEVPMVLKALLALAACHDAILSGASDWEASTYHGQCLELLIDALARPEDTYDDNLLITVVILRVYEELEQDSDQKCHLFGSNRLLNTMSKSASSGGLAEAVSWQFLRQAIYAAVVQSQPLQLDLQNYERSSVFHRADDAAYANRIVFLCARIVQLCTGAGARVVEEATWRQLSRNVEQWYSTKPITWVPLKYGAADGTENQPFPELWMISPPAVVGLQYYHAARIFLTASHARWHAGSDFEVARSRRLAERSIAEHLVVVIGLSRSNESVHNAYFMACHLLHRYGYCLRHAGEQQGSLRFLAHTEQVLGWRTAWIFEGLEQQWRELHGMDAWEAIRHPR